MIRFPLYDNNRCWYDEEEKLTREYGWHESSKSEGEITAKELTREDGWHASLKHEPEHAEDKQKEKNKKQEKEELTREDGWHKSLKQEPDHAEE